MKQIFQTLVLAGLLVLGGALAQEGSDSDQSDSSSNTEMTSKMSHDRSFEDFDTNADSEIDETEFDTNFRSYGLYQLFDAERSGSLDRVRFLSGLFDMLDTDMDGLLSESELAGLSAWGINQTLADLDTDQSGDVSREEFEQVDVEGVFTMLDADQSGDVSEEEFYRGIFTMLDTDQSGSLSEEEYNANPSLFKSRDDGMGMGGMGDDSSNDQGTRDDSDQDGTSSDDDGSAGDDGDMGGNDDDGATDTEHGGDTGGDGDQGDDQNGDGQDGGDGDGGDSEDGG